MPHNLLLYKLKLYGVSGTLLNWFSSYLVGRRQRVVIEGSTSDWLPVVSGVPQGSILGPFLFLLYINDLPSIISQESTLALFADDSKCYRPIKSVDDCLDFQDDVSAIKDWGDSWGMHFNSSKCKILRITRSLNPQIHPYYMGDNLISQVHVYRDLGFMVTSDLTWKIHVDSITKKANRSLGYVKRTCGFKAPLQAKKLLYISMVRSKLEVGVPVWSSHRRESLVKIEGVQRRATRFILRSDIDYKDRLSACDLMPLSLRREMLDLTFLFKCRQGLYSLDPLDFCSEYCPKRHTRRAGRGPLYNLPSFNTETFANSFFNRIVPLWNNLSVELRQCSLLSSFKRLLKFHYLSLFNNQFTTSNTCSWITKCRCANCRPKLSFLV